MGVGVDGLTAACTAGGVKSLVSTPPSPSSPSNTASGALRAHTEPVLRLVSRLSRHCCCTRWGSVHAAATSTRAHPPFASAADAAAEAAAATQAAVDAAPNR